MKKITETIVEQLNDETFIDGFETLVSRNPDALHGDVTVSEALEKFYTIKEILIQTANSGLLDSIPYNRRNAISSNLKAANQYRNNHSQLVPQIEAAYDQVTLSGLFASQLGQTDYEAEIKEIAKLKKRLIQLIKKFEETESNQQLLNDTKTELDSLINLVNNKSEEVETNRSESEGTKDAIETLKSEAEEIKGDIQTIKSDLDIKKSDIDAFYENVDNYRGTIEDLKTKAQNIIEKEQTINGLISQAEKALQLKSAEGLSAALSTQYTEASDWKNKVGWLIGAGFFILLATALTVWIVSGWEIEDPNSWSTIVGRVVAIGISITAATFCAQRYVKQKQISEDYAYKLTLAKSIVAFTEEIKKRDDKQVPIYLSKVLDEIHKDPLRPRSKPKEITLNEKSINYIEKLIDMVKSKVN